MLATLFSIAIGILPLIDDAPRPSDADVQAAKRLLKGSWDLVKIVDGGETLGPELIRRKIAQNARVSIDTLTVHHTQPDTMEEKVLAYRVNPAADPKQIDFINANSATFRAIYRFEGDQLSVCMNHEDNGPRPTGFESKSGTRLILMTLKLADSDPGPEQTPPVKVAAAVPVDPPKQDLFAAAPPAEVHKVAEVRRASTAPEEVTSIKIQGPTGDVKVLSEIAIPAAESERKPSESELQRDHDLLRGKWNIVSVTDGGERLGTELIRRRLAQDGQITIGNRVVQMTSPESGAKRISGYRINPAADPRQIDLTTEFDSVKKGIYRFDGEEVLVCLSNDSDGDRPTSFDAPQGSDRRLIRLHLSAPDAPSEPEPTPPPAPTAAELAKEREDTVRGMLVGSWMTSDSKGSVTTVLRPDGTFTTTREWAKAMKRLFDGQTSSASGRWSYANGLLRATVLSTSDRKMAGQTYYGRVQSIGQTTMVAEDGMGTLKNYKKLR